METLMDNPLRRELPQGIVVLAAGTRLDSTNAADFKNRFQVEAGRSPGRVVLDMTNLEFIDSMGLGALVMALKAMLAKGGDIRLAALSPEVRSLVELTRLDKIFDIHETVDTAVASYA